MTGEKIPPEKLERITEAIRLSASGFGLQPYQLLVIEDEELKRRIRPIAFQQPQIEESSHLLVFAAWDQVTAERIDEYLDLIVKTRGVPAESLEAFRNVMLGWMKSKSPDQNFQWTSKQTYIALGSGIVAAAMEGVDATPMEGFQPAALDEILNLKEKGLRSISLLALGYRDSANDSTLNRAKVRRAGEDFFIRYRSVPV